MVIFGGTGALGVVFAAHHIENATPRSIVSTSVILASRSGRGSTLGRVFTSRASPFVVRACAANAVSVDGASRIVPRDARAWIHAGGLLRDASVDAIAHGATRIVTSAKRSAAIRVDGVAELCADDVRRVFFLRRVVPRSAGQTSYAAANALVGRSRGASIAFGRSDRRRTVGSVGRRGDGDARFDASRATLAKRIRVSRSGGRRRRVTRRDRGGDGVHGTVSNPSCAWRARRGGGSRRTRRNVAETSRRSSPTSSNERTKSRIMRRDRRGHRRASPSIPTEPNPSLRSRLCVPIDRSMWRR